MTAKEDMVILVLDVALTLTGDLLDTAAERADNPAPRWRRDDVGLQPAGDRGDDLSVVAVDSRSD